MPNKSQISIEYLILTGFILLVIVVPAAIFLSSLANQSVYGTLNTQRAMDLGSGLVDNAKQIYYLGLYSKKVVDYTVPQNVKKMFILDLNDGSKDYYYIGIIIDNGKEVSKNYFPSTIPLMSDANLAPDYVEEGDKNILLPYIIDECEVPTTSCYFYNFKGPVIHEGKKSFKLETQYDANEVKVSITPIDLE
jgi:uncharacterized protein (UPF0333 family)